MNCQETTAERVQRERDWERAWAAEGIDWRTAFDPLIGLLAERGERIDAGPLTIWPQGRDVEVHRDDPEKRDRYWPERRELALLILLAREPERIFSKREIAEAMPGQHGEIKSSQPTQAVDRVAARTRRRLAQRGAEGLIVNCWGVGYRFSEKVG